MSFATSLLGIFGFGIGILIGLFLGFLLFVHSQPRDVKEPIIRPLQEFDSSSLLDILPYLPQWVKHPDYERVDWLNDVINQMWPYLDKAICGIIRSIVKPMFSEYVGTFQIRSIDFESLTLGTIPPVIHGMKVHESNEKHLVFEPVVRWAGNFNMTLVLNILSLHIKIQLIDLQISAAPRITLKQFVPTFPCFTSTIVSLLEKPQIDFGLKVMGGDLMAIPGLYQFVQETIRRQVARLYLWPQSLEIPILDSSLWAVKKPVGILHVKVVSARNLLNMDLFSTSDPYVQLSLSGERIPAKKTSVKMNNLDPVWNEDLKLTIKDPQSQVLEIYVYDWEKIGLPDKLGMQVILLNSLTPNEMKEFTLDLLKNLNPNDPHNKKPRGSITVELTFIPFIEETELYSGPLDRYARMDSIEKSIKSYLAMKRGGLLLVNVIGAENVEGKHHNNPYALVLFKGEQKKTKILKKTRDPFWNEEFQYVLEEPPIEDKIHIEIMSKRRSIGLLGTKEPLGYLEINLTDVVYNSHINEKYHLINSRNGVIHVDIRWKVT